MSGEESRREEELQLCKKELEIYKQNEQDCFTAGVDTAMAVLQNVVSKDEFQSAQSMIEMLSTTCVGILEALQVPWPEQTWAQIMLVNEMSRSISLIWGLARGIANSGASTDVDLSSSLMDEADLLRSEATLCLVAIKNRSGTQVIKEKMETVSKILAELKANGEKYAGKIVDEQDLADLVAQEISAMDAAIEEAAKRMEELLAASRSKDEGKKLEIIVFTGEQ
eukprot:TRINITY_DN35507_c0_g2_i2.p1 TRINITY_DN35507_c0_g2~~TRINITY_DN35507_c0_g2_i2.p1  ORF type:complete len:254 (-),score=79.24 TRINITY_DN35507_c0_g2_i2:649-1320(-)